MARGRGPGRRSHGHARSWPDGHSTASRAEEDKLLSSQIEVWTPKRMIPWRPPPARQLGRRWAGHVAATSPSCADKKRNTMRFDVGTAVLVSLSDDTSATPMPVPMTVLSVYRWSYGVFG